MLEKRPQSKLRTASLIKATLVLSIIILGFDRSLAAQDMAPGTVKPEDASRNSSKEYRQAMTNNHLSYALTDDAGVPVKPIAVARVDEDLYFLSSDCIWLCEGAKPVVGGEDMLVLKRLAPPPRLSLLTPWQEFNDFVYLPSRKSLIVLDKSGDLFEYVPAKQNWAVFRSNIPTTGAPDPDYIDLCSLGDRVALLDPERNQIWCVRSPKSRLEMYFREVLPWRLKGGDPNVSDGIAIGFSKFTYVLKRNGNINKYDGIVPYGMREHFVPFQHPAHLRPSRLCVGQGEYIYLVERENNRVTRVNPANSETACFLFPPDTNLRGMVISSGGFWIIDDNHLLYRSSNLATRPSTAIAARKLDPRLKGFAMPLAHQSLPRHPGVYPGARRLYRYGVHEGLDMFNVPRGTPVYAAQAGRVIRADTAFKDMDFAHFNRVMNECRRQHYTSARNEDLFRGCQVWIDHGNGIITRYAHLNAVSPGLKAGQMVKRQDLIGFVGVSGTGQDLPGRVPYPHLHFEINVDGKYLGWGLTPAETMGVYEDVFGAKK